MFSLKDVPRNNRDVISYVEKCMKEMNIGAIEIQEYHQETRYADFYEVLEVSKKYVDMLNRLKGAYINITEKDFYEYFEIPYLFILTDCQFFNEQTFNMCVGDDICEHTDIENFSCKKCKKSKPVYPYYPPITNELIINFLLNTGTENSNITQFTSQQDKQKLLSFVIQKAEVGSSNYNKIRKILSTYANDFKKELEKKAQ